MRSTIPRCTLVAIACLAGCKSAVAEPPPPDATRGFATPAQVFAKSAKAEYLGLEVHLQNVAIAGKAGRGFWIRNAAGRRVFVVPVDPSEIELVAVGARVDVRGELRRAPAARQAALILGVGRSTARRIAASPHIIDAWSITRPM